MLCRRYGLLGIPLSFQAVYPPTYLSTNLPVPIRPPTYATNLPPSLPPSPPPPAPTYLFRFAHRTVQEIRKGGGQEKEARRRVGSQGT